MTVEFLAVQDGPLAYRKSPGNANAPGVVFLGGYASDMEGSKATFLAQACAARNISFLRFDYRGCGSSPGDFRAGTIGGWLADSLAALDRLTQGPQILVGSSMGGWLALLAARARPERIKTLIGVAAAPDFTEDLVWEKLRPDQRDALKRDGEIVEDGAPPDRRIPLTRTLIEEGRNHLVLRAPFSLSCPVRLLQGMQDAEVPWETAPRLAAHLGQQDTRVTLIKNGDHRLSAPENLDLLERTVADFL